MSNVIPFNKRITSVVMAKMIIYQTIDEKIEVEMEVNDQFEDQEIFEAMMACSFKFHEECGLEEEE